MAVISELKRVLKKTGQLWLNLGDCFGTGSGAGSRAGTKQATNKGSNYYEDKGRQPPGELKCLMMMPERIALKMIDDGWILRNKIKWCKQVLLYKDKITKGSVMPTSVKDRFNESGEELYFFTKNTIPQYWTNPITKEIVYVQPKKEKEGIDFEWKMRKGKMTKITLWDAHDYYSDLDAVRLPNQVLGVTDFRASGLVRSAELYPNSKYAKAEGQGKIDGRVSKHIKASEEEINRYRKGSGANNPELRNRNFMPIKNPGRNKTIIDPNARGLRQAPEPGEPNAFHPAGKNLPTCWLIGSEPHNFQKETGVDTDHFASFPQALCEIPIKFGAPKDGIVLDPFAGSGTALVVAKKLGRNYIGIELNKKYIEIAEKRIAAIPQSLF